MPKAASSFSPLRLISPGMLGMCFILFFFPWIEIQCVPPAQTKAKTKEDDPMAKMEKEMIEKTKKEMGVDLSKPISFATQSGLQIATGGSSPGSDMKRIEEKMKEQTKKMAKDMGAPEPQFEKPKEDKKTKDKDDLKGAPLLFLYPVLLLAGMGVAFLPVAPMIRSGAVAGCCALALGVILLQSAIGFPIEEKVKNDKSGEMFGGGLMGGPMGPMGGGPDPGAKDAKGAKADKSSEPTVRVSWQFSLYLTLLLLIGAAGGAFIETLAGGGGKAKYGRKSRRDDYDDDDDDEDDRPRKKRRDDDDEEDERPKKKQKALSLDDDEEDERPKKKRRDEEEEEERPKKKARRDEEEAEDDRPKKRPRRDEDEEEDDRPRKKKSAEPDFKMPAAPPPPPPPPPAAPAGPNPFAFDEEEDRPKKKRRREEDDEDDDRPRKKRRRDDD